jgi:hypothetical protein
MSLQENDLVAFKANVEDLALDELRRLEADRKSLAEQLEAVTEQIKSVKAVLRAIHPGAKSGPKPKPKAATTPFSMSEEREGEFMRWLTEIGPEVDVTARKVYERFGWSESYCNMAVKMLREQGVLRLSATAGSTRIYRSML